MNKINLSALALTHFLLVACGGSNSSSDDSALEDQIQIDPANTAPTISGSPANLVTVGTSFFFQPIANDDDGDVLAFSISNQPVWLNFDSANGSLTGTPSSNDLGLFENITISVSDGEESAALGPFSINVTESALRSTEPESPTPLIENSTPLVDQQTEVPIGAILELSVDITAGEENSALVQLQAVGSEVSLPLRSYISERNTLLIDPAFDLKPNSEYYLNASGSFGDLSYKFTTGKVEWHAGGYILFAVDQAVNASTPTLVMPNAEHHSGIALRVSWPNLEDDQGNYDFSYLENALLAALATNKKVSVSVFPISKTLDEPDLGKPQRYFYSANRNPNSGNEGDCSRLADPFDDNYRSRYYQLLHELGGYLRDNPDLNDVVSYVIGAGDITTRNWAYGFAFQDLFSDSQCTESITWEEVGFDADSMIAVLQESVAVFMEAFPDKVLWLSVGDLKFDSQTLSCGSTHCVATTVADWALQHYPDRIGIWREDINANRGTPREGSLWSEISRYRPRVGAQMVFSVQGCPDNCRVADDGTEPDDALLEALKIAISNDTNADYGKYLMNYVEIYAADTQDDSLNHVFADIDLNERWLSDRTPPAVPINLSALLNTQNHIEVTWAAATDRWDKENVLTDALTPAADKAATQSISYQLWRDDQLIAKTHFTSFIDTDAPVASLSYSVIAVDAAGNESGPSAPVVIAKPE